MSIPVHCRNCGYRGTARYVQVTNTRNMRLGGGSEDCPICGGRAEYQLGYYDFVGSMMTAFRELSRDNIEAFRDIAEAVKSGEASSEDAAAQIAKLGSTLAGVWRWTNENSGALTVLLSVLTLYLAITAGWRSDETAEKLRASVERQTQVEQMMLSELRKLHAADAMRGVEPRPKPRMQSPNRLQTPAPATRNRHERRKAARLAKRHPSC